VAGLSERNEYDWNLDKVKLDLKKLDASCWPEQLAELDKKTIKPLFTTDFSREYAEIAWGRGKSKVVIEAALDQGFVIAGKRKKKSASWSWSCAKANRKRCWNWPPNWPPACPDAVRHQQGRARLPPAGAGQLRAGPAATELDAEMPLDDAFAALAWQLLGSSQRLAEQYRHNGHWRLLQDWVECLSELRALTASLGQAAPRATTRDLRASLDALLEDWRPLVQAGNDDEDIRRAAPEQFAEELEDALGPVLAGNLALAAGPRLDRRAQGPWRTPGQGATGQLAGHLLGEEARALKLPLYTAPGRPGRAAAAHRACRPGCTTPARCWKLPQMDRLYGELNKLHELAEQSDGLDEHKDELLEAHRAGPCHRTEPRLEVPAQVAFSALRAGWSWT
jgi:hypothetical protein